MPLRYVRQEHPNGCGIAALAMACGQSYAAVLAWFRPWPIEDRGLNELHLNAYLFDHGFAWQLIHAVFQAQQSNMRRTVWPPRPWAPAHIVQVAVPSGYHFVAMDDAGAILDPFREDRRAFDHDDYAEVNFVMGIWRVREDRR